MNISVRTNPVHITDRVNIMNPKLLITLKEADFQWPTIPLKRIFLVKKLLQNVVASFNTLLLTPSELRLVHYLLQN